MGPGWRRAGEDGRKDGAGSERGVGGKGDVTAEIGEGSGEGEGGEGEGGWRGRDGRVWFDCLPWYNYLAFDIIGEYHCQFC